MASTIAAITTGVGGVVTTADATGNLSLLSGTTTVVAVTSTGASVTGNAIIGASTSGAAQVALNTGGGALTKFIELYYQSGSPSSSSTDYGNIQAGYQGSYWTNLALNPNGGNVGIGTASPAYKLHSATTIGTGSTGNNGFVGFKRSSDGVEIGSMNTDGTNLVVNTGTALAFQTSGTEQMRIDSAGLLKFNSGYGSAATAYGCRAWVNFNGTGTVAIRASGNVSSITDNGVGDYTVNFTTAMVDANYSALSTTVNRGGFSSPVSNICIGFGSAVEGDTPSTYSTSAVRLYIQRSSGGSADLSIVNVAVFR